MKVRVMAHPRDKFAGRYRLGRFFASGKWEELDVSEADAATLRADKRLLVEAAEPASPASASEVHEAPQAPQASRAKGPAPRAEG